MAFPQTTYEEFFQLELIQLVIKNQYIKLIRTYAKKPGFYDKSLFWQ
ncbi:MAG: hypothetical protein F6K40_13840 [Okeania sp. SIO3I5]|nr:hypothetical protein [Okeania sp. SIO3I5]